MIIHSIKQSLTPFQYHPIKWRIKNCCLLPVLFAALFSTAPCWSQDYKPVRVGDFFLPFTLKNNLSKQELEALKLTEQKTISLNDFKAEIIIIEMLNVHCHTCQLQVPVFNQLWDTIQSDAVLKSKVAMVGITVGNTAQEIITFQKSFQPRYPVLADPLKEVFNSLSNPKGTPQTYLVRRDLAGKWFILHHHRGAVDSHEIYLQKIKEFFKTSLEGVEPGYRVPQVLMQSLEKNYPAQSFDSQRILLYFPSTVTFPLETDSRNRENQMPVLRSLLGEENLALVIIGALNQLFPPQELATLTATSGIFLLEDVTGTLRKLFEVAENPLICLINDSGGIVYRAGSLPAARAEEVLEGTFPELKPSLGEAELLALMQQSMREINRDIASVEKKELVGGGAVYVGFTPLSARAFEGVLFGRVVSKYSICDVCHDIHYYFIFDQNGHLISFKPIHVTKYGNVTLDQQDIDKIQGRLAGKDLFTFIPFDPEVDAVSQATMSSYLIFEGINETEAALSIFKENGFRKEFWKELCLANLCQIKKALSLLKQKGVTGSLTLEDNTTIDVAKLKPFLPSPGVAQCPAEGKYLLIGEIPLCSTHGMNLQTCPEDAGTAGK